MKIEPYKKHYINCYVNNLLSIGSINNKCMPDYVNMNYYTYSLKATANGFYYLHMDYTYEFYKKLYETVINRQALLSVDNIVKQPLGNYISIGNSIEICQDYLTDEACIFAKIDIYYLDLNAIYYHRIHKEHMMMLSGYDDFSESYQVLDYGKDGYDKYVLSKKELEECLLNRSDDINYVYYPNEKKEIKIFTYCESDITTNVKRIIQELDVLLANIDQINTPNTHEEMGYIFMFIQRCQERNEINKELIANNVILDMSELNEAMVLCDELSGEWYRVRAITMRWFMRNAIFKLEEYKERIRRNLLLERKLWGIIISKHFPETQVQNDAGYIVQ